MNNIGHNRVLWVDVCKTIAMFLVVWGHCILHGGQNFGYEALSGWIYSFHMPLFMILSGFVSYKICEGNATVMRRFEQLIVPSAFLFVICYVIGFDANWWFLKSLFACYLIWTLLFRMSKVWRIIVLVVMAVFLFPLLKDVPYIKFWKIDFMLPFFGIGLLLFSKRKWIEEHIWIVSVISFVSFIILWFFWRSQYVYYFSRPKWIDYEWLIYQYRETSGIHYSLEDGMIIMKNIYCYVYRFLIGTAGSISCISLCILLCRNMNKSVNSLAYLGRYSLHIYILHSFVIWLSLDSGLILKYLYVPSNVFLYYGYTFLLAVVIFVICYLLAKVMEQSEYVNKYIFGKV